jgi:hypothetical protein
MIATLVKAGTAARCDLSILFLESKAKRSQRAAPPTGLWLLLSFIYQSTLKINLTNIFCSETLKPFG